MTYDFDQIIDRRHSDSSKWCNFGCPRATLVQALEQMRKALAMV